MSKKFPKIPMKWTQNSSKISAYEIFILKNCNVHAMNWMPRTPSTRVANPLISFIEEIENVDKATHYNNLFDAIIYSTLPNKLLNCFQNRQMYVVDLFRRLTVRRLSKDSDSQSYCMGENFGHLGSFLLHGDHQSLISLCCNIYC